MPHEIDADAELEVRPHGGTPASTIIRDIRDHLTRHDVATMSQNNSVGGAFVFVPRS